MINFDIMIHTARGAIFAYRFVQDADVCVACTDVSTIMNIQKAHGLLGHGDEESTRKITQELGYGYSLVEHSNPVFIVQKQRQSRKMCVKKEQLPR